MSDGKNRYVRLIEDIFNQYYREGVEEVAFERDDLVKTAKKLGISLPKNHNCSLTAGKSLMGAI